MPVLALVVGGACGAQTCKYDSIAATAPASRFTDHGDGTVTDQATGLQWKRCTEGQTWSGGRCTGTPSGYAWPQALQRAAAVSFAGKGDWRLPNYQEAIAIVEEACSAPAVDAAVFPATRADWYWTSSPELDDARYTWALNFDDGEVSEIPVWDRHWIRLVRGGP